MSRNYGEQFVDQVRDYLTANGLKTLGQINATILADLAQRFYEKYTAANKTKRLIACEEEWIAKIEKDPAMKGVDVRRELGKAQFWCKQNRRICTRAFFSNWLIKADKSVAFTYDGASSRPQKVEPRPQFNLDTPVPGWPMLVRNHVCLNNPEAEVDFWCSGDWSDLPIEIRQKVLQHT